MRRSAFASLAFSTCATLALAAELPKDDAVKPVEVVRTGDYSEGVVVDYDGNLYFSHGTMISKVSPEAARMAALPV